jgi:ketosteroid isomerase-like protein
MKKAMTGLLFILFLAGCRPSSDQLKKEIMDTDRAFSAMSKDKGMNEAFIFYAANEVIKPNPNHQPVVGKEALIKFYKNSAPKDAELTWEPLKADADGDIGYTFGNYFLKTRTPDLRDTVLYGNYVSIWKRQPDGQWRFVLDTGNSTPEPSKLDR